MNRYVFESMAIIARLVVLALLCVTSTQLEADSATSLDEYLIEKNKRLEYELSGGNVASVIREATSAIETGLATLGPTFDLSATERAAMEPTFDFSAYSTPLLAIDATGSIQTYIHVESLDGKRIIELQGYGVKTELVNEELKIIQAWIPFDQINNVSELLYVERITAPNYVFPQAGSVLSEGSEIHLANELHNIGIDGSGVKVGVISNGMDNASEAEASGDLPFVEAVTFAGNGDEGTALLEIIHDLAPGALLGFCGAGTSLEFIRCVQDLDQLFGADIIVDDLGFFGEPYFEDGPTTNIVANALAGGAIYISAAGNSAQRHYEADFEKLTTILDGIPKALQAHNFGAAAGLSTDATMNVQLQPGGWFLAFLQWNDKFGSSNNDYDLLLFDDPPTRLLALGAERQTGDDDPREVIFYGNLSLKSVNVQVAVNLYKGEARRLEMYFSGVGFQIEEYNVPTGSIYGHRSLPEVLAIGAINASDEGHDDIEPFSSHGPSQIFFPVQAIREKPDLVAVDGVSISGASGFETRFFGTSAAAPHVAGIAALLKEAFPSATSTRIATAMMRSAVDLGTFGRDRIFGMGRADAVAGFQWLSNSVDSVFSFATGIVEMPAVQLPDGRVFSVLMRIIPGSNPTKFEIISVSGIEPIPNSNNAAFSFETGILDIPRVQLPGDEIFAVSMQHIPGSDPLTFELTVAHQVE